MANTASETEMLKKENEALKKIVSSGNADLEILRKEVIDKPKVAFSAGLSASVGPLGVQGVVVYTKVLTNIGGAYNPNSGIFTAPTTGVYYFRFTACGGFSGQYAGASLYKNHERLTHIFEYNSDNYARHFSAGVAIHLTEGDNVSVRIPSSHKLYEDNYTRNIFSGFLLFQTTS